MPKPGAGSGKASIKGTRGNDEIAVVSGGVLVNGTLRAFSDAQIDAGFIISGDAGDDTIAGGRGPDELKGGAGSDRLTGGDGLDRLDGGDGNDVLSDAVDGAFFIGGRGTDLIDLGEDTANIGVDLQGYVMTGVQHYYAPTNVTSTFETFTTGRVSGVENLVTGSGNDFLGGNNGDNALDGSAGNDTVWGRAGNDILHGGDGLDYLGGGPGNDRLSGGAGPDVFVMEHDEGHDAILDFDKAEDRLDFFSTARPTAWEFVDFEGVDSLRGYFDGGLSSITLVGVTSLDGVQITGL